jgi:hypothetical protein
MSRYEVREVLAGCYRGGRAALKSCLTHVVELEGKREVRVLCGLPVDSLCDVPKSGVPTCPRCLRACFRAERKGRA